jgi:transposase-like protein
LALIVLSVVEQRLDAVRAVLAGAEVIEVADRIGVHRSTVHRWVARYLAEQIGGLADRSHRPHVAAGQHLAFVTHARTLRTPKAYAHRLPLVPRSGRPLRELLPAPQLPFLPVNPREPFRWSGPHFASFGNIVSRFLRA